MKKMTNKKEFPNTGSESMEKDKRASQETPPDIIRENQGKVIEVEQFDAGQSDDEKTKKAQERVDDVYAQYGQQADKVAEMKREIRKTKIKALKNESLKLLNNGYSEKRIKKAIEESLGNETVALSNLGQEKVGFWSKLKPDIHKDELPDSLEKYIEGLNF